MRGLKSGRGRITKTHIILGRHFNASATAKGERLARTRKSHGSCLDAEGRRGLPLAPLRPLPARR